MQDLNISLEFTPNPNTLKFLVNQVLLDRGAANFTSADQTAKSPLAKRLFEIPGVMGVMIGTQFITITKSPTGDWDIIADEIPKAIENHLKQNLPIFDADFHTSQPSTSNPNETEVEKKIKEILDTEIRPAVAMDGGDIQFEKFEEGIVYLHLQGSCSSCPSSVATLKMGVESRLKDAIPEVKEVVQI